MTPTARTLWSPQSWPGLLALLAVVVGAGILLGGAAFKITGPLHERPKGVVMPSLATSRRGITHYVKWDRFTKTYRARCGATLKVPFDEHQGIDEIPKGVMCPKCYKSLLDELLWDAAILKNLSTRLK